MASLKKRTFFRRVLYSHCKIFGNPDLFGVAGVLSRLIAPEEFGVITVATVVISFFSVFQRFGNSSRSGAAAGFDR